MRSMVMTAGTVAVALLLPGAGSAAVPDQSVETDRVSAAATGKGRCAAPRTRAGRARCAATRLPQGSQPVRLDPRNFTTNITNPYWPMAPGTKWVYRETDDEGEVETVEVTVTDQTKVIAGVTARVVRDTVTDAEGELVEDTSDWFAQDRAGTIWYLGEDTKEFDEGELESTKGSWEHGVGGAFAGVVMPANPRVGMRYRQEFAKGEAEDRGEILSLTDRAEVPFGRFTDVLLTKDTTPLEPAVLENKRYARGIGPVLTIDVPTGAREELVSFEKRAP